MVWISDDHSLVLYVVFATANKALYALYNGVFPWWAWGELSCAFSDGLSVHSHCIGCISGSCEECCTIWSAFTCFLTWLVWRGVHSHWLHFLPQSGMGGPLLGGPPSTPLAISGEKYPSPLWSGYWVGPHLILLTGEQWKEGEVWIHIDWDVFLNMYLAPTCTLIET